MYDFKSSFLTLLTIALCDTNISPEEVQFLYDIGIQNGISEKEVDDILMSPHKNKIEFPTDKNDKIELLYNCSKMIWADGKVLEEEIQVLKRIISNLGIKGDKINQLSDYLLKTDRSKTEKQEITNFIKNII